MPGNSAQVQEGFNSTAVVAYYIMVAKMWRMSIRAVVHLLPDVFFTNANDGQLPAGWVIVVFLPMRTMVNFLLVG